MPWSGTFDPGKSPAPGNRLLTRSRTDEKVSAMTHCVGVYTGESAPRFDETYWDHHAAQPVLLIDEATEAITEAVYRLRAGSVLDDRDVTAAGVALDDLFGGLQQLTELLPATTRSATGQRPNRSTHRLSA